MTTAPPKFKGYSLVPGKAGDLGRGAWNQVSRYRDRFGNEFAVKRRDPTAVAIAQQAERGLTDDDLTKKECLNGSARSLPGLAFNFINYDENGNPYLFEEVIDRFLSDRLAEGELPLEETLHVASGMATGFDSLHTKLGRTHGDAHPANVGYTTDGDVKLCDFGASTVGDKELANVGLNLVRAPERFRRDRIVPASDIWAFGSILYRMLAGEYPLEQDFQEFQDPDELIRYLTRDRFVWNQTMHRKLNRSEIPKPFKGLLENCLCDEESRIQDGGQLKREMAQAERRYQKSRWPSRTKRWGAASLGVLTLAGLGYHQLNLDRENEELTTRVATANRELSTQQKLEAIKLHQQVTDTYFPDINSFWGNKRVLAWLEKFDGHPMTAYAAYLNPQSVYQAIQINGGREDYKSISPIIKRINPSLYSTLNDLHHPHLDAWMRTLTGNEARIWIDEEWQEVERDFNTRLDSLAAEYQEHQKEIEELRQRRENSHPSERFGMVGDTYNIRIRAHYESQERIAEQISAMTGDSLSTIAEKIAAGSYQPE